MMFVNFSAGRFVENPGMNRAVAASLIVHLLFLACFVSQPGFAGKGGGHGVRLEIRLSAISEKVSAEPSGLSAATEEAMPAVLSRPASMPVESALPQSGDESEKFDPTPARVEIAKDNANENKENDEPFFTRSYLTVPPVRVSDSAIDEVLSTAGKRLAPGAYFLRLFIDRNGQVVEVRGRSSRDETNGENSDLVFEQLIAAFKSIRFLPAEINGRAVNSQVEFEIKAVDVIAGSSRRSH
jgi:hypothetical protein